MAAATIDRGCSPGVDSRLRRPGFRRCERDRLESHLTDITHVIQLAVAPVFLLTAIATLINALNIRLGRGIDRRRLMLGRIRNVDYVVLLCDDWDGMCAFYRDTLGFPVYREWDGWCELGVGSVLLTLRRRGRL